MKKIKQYKAKLIGKDGFEKEVLITEPVSHLFIPIIKDVSCYIGEPISPNDDWGKRTFLLNEKFRNRLVYREI